MPVAHTSFIIQEKKNALASHVHHHPVAGGFKITILKIDAMTTRNTSTNDLLVGLPNKICSGSVHVFVAGFTSPNPEPLPKCLKSVASK